MIIKQLVDEDFINYKKPSMFLAFPSCTFKCEKECGKSLCQNSSLVKSPNIDVPVTSLVNRYISNPITQVVVLGGLEPFDSWEELQHFIMGFRYKSSDEIVIYTGYTEVEVKEKIDWLKQFPNIVIKFGRYIPNQQKHYDETLGVFLASDNQYGKRIS
jgi:organic radical activating enzyme